MSKIKNLYQSAKRASSTNSTNSTNRTNSTNHSYASYATSAENENEYQAEASPERAIPPDKAAVLLSTRPIATAQRQALVQNVAQHYGNRQVQRMLASVKKSPTTQVIQRTIGDGHDLTSPRFKGDIKLEACYDDQDRLNLWDRGESVKKVQQALVDLGGYDLGKYGPEKNGADGIYGPKTSNAIKKFKADYGLGYTQYGSAGAGTIRQLNKLFPGAQPTPLPPKKKEAEIEATDKDMGNHIVKDMTQANGPGSHSPSTGIWYDYNYLQAQKAEKDKYPLPEAQVRLGYANPEYFEQLDQWDWRLKPGKSAAEGIQAWLKGLTIAECYTTLIAMEYDTLRAAAGDDKFDARFGSTTSPVAANNRLRIFVMHNDWKEQPQIRDFMKFIAAPDPGKEGTKGNRPVHKGEWYYFRNHPKYLLKHPGGAWQGENALCMDDTPGRQLWAGLGADTRTEQGMLTEITQVYNQGRDSEDVRTLNIIKAQNSGMLPAKYEDNELSFPRQATEQQIEAEGGGLDMRTGQKLDVAKVQELRDK